MRRIFSLILLVAVAVWASPPGLAAAVQDAVKSVQPSQTPAAVLLNRDVLEMFRAGLAPEIIHAKIKASASDFDTSVAALERLKAEGLPDALILAMVMAPKVASVAGPSRVEATTGQPTGVEVKVPKGTVVEVETAYLINSQDVREGDAISFRVINPVKVGGVTVIASDATATARVVKASRGGHFGRAGRLAWSMLEVTAIDGTRIPIEANGRTVGDSKGAKVATQTVIFGALMGPLAPLALLGGFKRGGNAYIPAGKRFDVFVRAEATVRAAQTK